MKIVTSEQMRQIDQECAKVGLATSVLMENAGKAVAEETRRILGAASQQHILVLVGPGNNGGDGLVCARYLHDWGAKVSVYLCRQRPPDDANLKLVRERNIACVEAAQDGNLSQFDELLGQATCVIDAIFGTGKARPLEGTPAQILTKVAQAKERNPSLHLIALDLPSGLNADNGAVDPACPRADDTITLAFPKLGLFCFPGAERVGRLTIVDIGIPSYLAEEITAELITDDWAKTTLPKRPPSANKGTFGRVLVVAGSINYIGAAYLACSGAMRAGAGLVTLATAASLQPILAAKLTETTYLPLLESEPGIISPEAAELLSQQMSNYNVLLLGCGLGQSQPAIEFVNSLLARPALPALVLDADALNTLAKTPRWWQQLTGEAILTPHPGEMARLSGLSIAEIQQDRVGTARKFALEWQKTVVLKGAHSVIATPEGRCRISPWANPGLASAGTGDVLTGVIAGLVAQGLSLFDAAALGVYLHGKAAEVVRETMGDAGMLATDLLPALPRVIKQLKEVER
ncbi:MAG TPA: NAD(P)H-hydrate dehydratase [Dehalococcoidia bacterium]|jgi:NAD(P)H-hydrate epimerase|nr:NAD(P)H-hydrate dehydratase [Dehalococcoidia bacterium]